MTTSILIPTRAAAVTGRSRAAIAPQALFGRSTATVDSPSSKTKSSRKGSKNDLVKQPASPQEMKKERKDRVPVTLKKQSILEAFDFSAARSEDDAILIAKARGMRRGQKMSPEQTRALKRKIGGTAKDYWKGWVDVKGSYVDKGYVSDEDDAISAPPGVLFLALTVAGLAAATVAVVVKVG